MDWFNIDAQLMSIKTHNYPIDPLPDASDVPWVDPLLMSIDPWFLAANVHSSTEIISDHLRPSIDPVQIYSDTDAMTLTSLRTVTTTPIHVIDLGFQQPIPASPQLHDYQPDFSPRSIPPSPRLTDWKLNPNFNLQDTVQYVVMWRHVIRLVAYRSVPAVLQLALRERANTEWEQAARLEIYHVAISLRTDYKAPCWQPEFGEFSNNTHSCIVT
jgi:hypothetical protein